MISTNSAIMYFFGVFRLYISILFLYMSSEYHKLTGLIAEGLKAGKPGCLFTYVSENNQSRQPFSWQLYFSVLQDYERFMKCSQKLVFIKID